MKKTKFTAIRIYKSPEKKEVQMTDLIDKYFKSRSNAVSKLDFKKELRSFAVFLRSLKKELEIKIDPEDANDKTVRALFLAGAAMLVDPPKRGGDDGDYMTNNYRKKKESLIRKFKATVRKWLKKSNEQKLKAVYASILDVAGMVPLQLLVCYESDLSTYKKILRFLLVSVAASHNSTSIRRARHDASSV